MNNLNEKQKTIAFAGGAILLMFIALVTGPSAITPDAFLDQGEQFFPEFTDPNLAHTLEVVEFDAETGAAIPFKVSFKNGLWTIPSHNNYPADGKDRLAKTAAGVIGIKKDDFRSDNLLDHQAAGVLDPLDETETALTGRGKRITLKNENDVVLADFIVGNEIEGREGFKFVRVPDQKRIYAVRMDIDLSTNFVDWIEADLLVVEKEKITNVVLHNYKVNEVTKSVEESDKIILTKDDPDWKANNMRSNQEIDKTKMDELLKTLDELNIVGVRPKPAGLSASLSAEAGAGAAITQNDLVSLQNKGFYMTRDGGLRSNEGEIIVETNEGIRYTLRFGEIAYGSGLAVSAGTDQGAPNEGGGENRYLFISANYLDGYFKEPAKPSNTDFTVKPDSSWTDSDKRNKEMQDSYNEWSSKVEKGMITAQSLNSRFAGWYYVLSAESFDKLKLKRTDLVKKKE